MPENRQLIDRTLGELLARMVRTRWPRDTSKTVARAWGVDSATADNLIKGHASERTLTKALRAEGWGLLDQLGIALTGMTHHEWEEQRLKAIIEEAERAQETVRSLRAARERLEARAAALDAVGRGSLAVGLGLGDGLTGPGPAGIRNHEAGDALNDGARTG